jgi:hypothetical protein
MEDSFRDKAEQKVFASLNMSRGAVAAVSTASARVDSVLPKLSLIGSLCWFSPVMMILDVLWRLVI